MRRRSREAQTPPPIVWRRGNTQEGNVYKKRRRGTHQAAEENASRGRERFKKRGEGVFKKWRRCFKGRMGGDLKGRERFKKREVDASRGG